MRIPGLKTAKNISRWVQARLLGGAIILGYHRVAKVGVDEYDVCVSPDHFSEHMAFIRSHAHPISLLELVQHLRNGSLPARSVAVTFDDGYADNLYNAKPILEKYQIPATIFVCTGNPGREFWWDELVRLVMESHSDPYELKIPLARNQFQWDQPVTNQELKRSDRTSIRVIFHNALYQFLLSLETLERDQAMTIIRNWSGVSENNPTDRRSMDHDELKKIIEGDLIHLGAHTRTHPMLTNLPLVAQKEEITAGKEDLENCIGRQVQGFAYPNGRITTGSRRMVQEAGYEYACVSLHNVVRPGNDPYQLTRFWQKNVNGDKFLQGLNLWMNEKKKNA